MKVGAASDERLAALAEAVRHLSAPFACGGSVTIAAPVELRLGETRVKIEEDPGRKLGPRLVRACPPAPFGVGGETRHDPRVRDGRQLLARDGALEVEGVPLEELLEATRRGLCPSDAAPPVAELYALNVYPRGGHFVAHKDTPRDPAVFGTLVVCLPIHFRGGRLTLAHDDGARVFDWEDSWFSRRRALTLRWAAFFGDVDHAIEPVTEGTRVTLTWNLRRADAGGRVQVAHAPQTIAADKAPLEASLREALADPAWLRGGGVLAIPCAHQYAEERGGARATRPGPALDAESAGNLKGRDRLFAEVGLAAGLEVSFRPYLFEDAGGDSWPLVRDLTPSDQRLFRRHRLAPDDLEALPLAGDPRRSSDDDAVWLFAPPWSFGHGPRRDDLHAPRRVVGEAEYSATDYFGNEGCDSTFYVAGALHLVIPPSPRTTPEAEPVVAEALVEGVEGGALIDLIVLACKTNTIRARVLGTPLEVTWRTAIRDQVPGTIVTVAPTKRWARGRASFIAGRTIATRLEPEALGLSPLRLEDAGMWDPRDEIDPADPEVPPWFAAIAEAGPRPAFEMEQVLPGAGPDFEDGPISEAVDLTNAGDRAGARALLMDLLAQDLRCLDAHAHLGNLVLDHDPTQALRHYEVGVALGELALGDGFGGVLPWGLVDNRPYLRCLYGRALAHWRRGETALARAVFVEILWLNPGDHQGARFCLDAIDRGLSWDELHPGP
ncbi:MAG: hypothetical protein IT385_15570 [Deltaproteobacteria bacterium]|nr:hypothetical protein [Deltaproteobacteria bacterium]